MRELIVSSTKKVVEQAQSVSLNQEKIADLAKRGSLHTIPNWDKGRHFCDGTAQTAQWLFVLDSLNFSFWGETGKDRWTVLWDGEAVKGYWALACSLNQAMRKGVRVTDAKFLENIDAAGLKDIFNGTGDIPMMPERVRVLNEIGTVLQKQYDGSFANLLEEAGPLVERVVHLVVNNFPCFDDRANYEGDSVYFFKRAQILVSDIWGAFEGKGLGGFKDMNRLTAFADYKLPQVLRALGILQYNPELASCIDALKELASGSRQEIEIRAATVTAVEELARCLAANGNELPAFAIDWWLWEISHEASYERLPHHRTRSIFY